jgi:hypothetical protein
MLINRVTIIVIMGADGGEDVGAGDFVGLGTGSVSRVTMMGADVGAGDFVGLGTGSGVGKLSHDVATLLQESW